MRVRVAAALAVVAVAGLSPGLGAQARTGGSRPRSPASAPTRGVAPSIALPGHPTIHGPVAPFVVGHHPIPLRSSIFGLVLFDPYWWWAPDLGGDAGWLPPPPPPRPLPTGGVQLDVEPRRALVYVDGIFAGRVENFSGYFQHLDAPAGVHWIEVVAPDYEPLITTVSVAAGRTSTYRGSLTRASGRF